MNYNYKVYYSRIGSEKIEEMTLTERDSITALLTFHASMQREHKLGRDDYQILRFHQKGYLGFTQPVRRGSSAGTCFAHSACAAPNFSRRNSSS